MTSSSLLQVIDAASIITSYVLTNAFGHMCVCLYAAVRTLLTRTHHTLNTKISAPRQHMRRIRAIPPPHTRFVSRKRTNEQTLFAALPYGTRTRRRTKLLHSLQNVCRCVPAQTVNPPDVARSRRTTEAMLRRRAAAEAKRKPTPVVMRRYWLRHANATTNDSGPKRTTTMWLDVVRCWRRY